MGWIAFLRLALWYCVSTISREEIHFHLEFQFTIYQCSKYWTTPWQPYQTKQSKIILPIQVALQTNYPIATLVIGKYVPYARTFCNISNNNIN